MPIHTRSTRQASSVDDMPRTPEELHAWLRKHLDVQSPRSALLDSSDAPFAYLCHAFFEGRGCKGGAKPSAQNPPDCVVWANRGGGKTFLGAVATLLDLVWKPGIEVRILGGSLEQSTRMYEHLRGFFERRRFAGLVRGRMTRREIALTNGSRVQILAQSETAVRGTRVQKLRCDEVDIFDPEIWRAAQLTTRSIQVGAPWSGWVRGSIEALSTMHRPMGLMWQVVGDSARGGTGLPTGQVSTGAVEATAPEVGSTPETGRKTSPTTNPTRVLFRWGIVDALERCAPERACATCVLEPECRGKAKERPIEEAGHISIEDAAAAKVRVSLPVWEAEMLCLRPTRGDAVYPEFDPAVHVFAPEPRRAPDGPGAPTDELAPQVVAVSARRARRPEPQLICGMDFGFRAPTVILWAEVSPGDEAGDPPLDRVRVVRVIAEHSAVESRLESHIERIQRSPWGRPAWIGIDPAGRQRELQAGGSCATALQRAGLDVRIRPTGTHEGINLVRWRLAPAATGMGAGVEGGEGRAIGPTLFVSSACAVLIESLTKYHFDEARPESLDPVKDGSDHACDALRYMLTCLDRPYRSRRRET